MLNVCLLWINFRGSYVFLSNVLQNYNVFKKYAEMWSTEELMKYMFVFLKKTCNGKDIIRQTEICQHVVYFFRLNYLKWQELIPLKMQTRNSPSSQSMTFRKFFHYANLIRLLKLVDFKLWAFIPICFANDNHFGLMWKTPENRRTTPMFNTLCLVI